MKKIAVSVVAGSMAVAVAFAGKPVSQPIPDDVRLLVGKRVIVGRLPLCEPSSYNANLQYSGKKATVVSFKENTSFPKLSPDALNRIPAGSRSLVEDAMKGGNMTFQFHDGTRLDTCGLAALSALKQNLELAPGEKIDLPPAVPASVQPPQPTTQATGTATPQQCPVQVVDLSSGDSLLHGLLDALTKSEFQRQLDQTLHGRKHYLDMRVRNDSDRPVAGVEMVATYANNMGDVTTSATYISQNDEEIAPGEDYKANAMDRSQWSASGVGKVTLHIQRVRFADGTFWQDDGSRSCSRSTATE